MPVSLYRRIPLGRSSAVNLGSNISSAPGPGNYVLNLMDYLNIKKTSSLGDVNNLSKMTLHMQNDGVINCMESIKDKILAIMECSNCTLRNRLLQFLVMASNFQPNF